MVLDVLICTFLVGDENRKGSELNCRKCSPNLSCLHSFCVIFFMVFKILLSKCKFINKKLVCYFYVQSLLIFFLTMLLTHSKADVMTHNGQLLVIY